MSSDYKLSASVEMEATSYDKGMQEAENVIDGFQAKCSEVDRSLKSSTGNIQESCARIGDGLVSMGKKATLAAAPVTIALTAIGKRAATTAIDFTKLYESTMVVFEKMLGGRDAANALYASLLDVAKASTFSQETFLSAGKALVGVGVSAEDTVKYMQAITDAVAGFGGSGETIERLADAFKKVQTNGKLSMMEVSMLADAGVNALAILGNQYDVTTEEMRNMISSGALPAAEALSKLADGIENGTDGANGMTQAMSGMAEAMKGGTLTGALDGMNTAIRSFSLALVGINPTLKETDAGYEESQKRIEQLTAAIMTINEIIPLMAKMFSGVTSAIGKVLDALVGTNLYLDDSTKKWTNVNGALGDFKHYLEVTPTDRLAAIGNGLALIAVAGPTLMITGKAIKGVGAAVTAMTDAYKVAKAVHMTYRAAVAASTAAMGAQTIATKVHAAATGGLTAAQSLLNAAMLANPAGVALVAIVALTAGVVALKTAYDSINPKQESVTAATKKQAEEIEWLRGRYEALSEKAGENADATLKAKAALDEAEEAYRRTYKSMDTFLQECDDMIQKHQEMAAEMDDVVSAADDEAGKLLNLGSKFNELAGHVDGDASKKAELQAVVNALNGEMEGLNLTINEQTGDIEGNTDAVYALIKAEADRIRSKAHYEKLADAIDREAELTNQLTEAQNELMTASTEATTIVDQFGMTNVLVASDADKLKERIVSLTGEIKENREEQGESISIIEQMASKEAALGQAVEEVKNGTLDAAAAAEKYSDANTGLVITAEEVAEQFAVVRQEIDENVQAIKDYAKANPAFQRAMSNAGYSAESLNTYLGNLGLEFEDLSSAFEDCVTDITSGLDKIDTASQISLGKLIENLQANAEATRNWKDNCMTVWNSVPAELRPTVQQMIEAGPEQFGLAMQQLSGLSQEEMTAMVQSMADSTDSMTNDLADLLMATYGFTAEQANALAGLLDYTDGYGQTLSANLALPDGSLNYSMIAEALNAAGFDATEIANLTSDQIAAALNIDPSQIDMSEITAAVANEEPNATDAAEDTGDSTGSTFTDSTAKKIDEQKGQISNAAVSAVSNAASVASPLAKSGGYLVGMNMGLGIANGMRSTSGLIVAAAVSAVNSAVAAARAAGEIKSPSRRTEREVGRELIVGAARGVTKNAYVLDRAMASSVTRSIDAVPVGGNMTINPVPSYGGMSFHGLGPSITRSDVAQAVSSALGSMELSEMAVYIDGDKLVGHTAKKMNGAIGKIQSREKGGL